MRPVDPILHILRVCVAALALGAAFDAILPTLGLKCVF